MFQYIVSLYEVMAEAQAALEEVISSDAAQAEREAEQRMTYFRLDRFYEVRGLEIQRTLAERTL